jgi:AmmeMemoRadiSam system protein A
MALTRDQEIKLLALARHAIAHFLHVGQPPPVTETDPALLAPAGAFVTLHQGKSLRGCIGRMEAVGPLAETVRDMAIAAATEDWRFPRLEADDLGTVTIEISVLTPMRKVASPEEIEVGRHGVMAKMGAQCGVFLPQVAPEQGWNREQMLTCLCGEKAGLPPDAWKKGADLYVFEASVFSEESA